jgi:membrane associated rhomboid family serine protease
VRSVHDLIPLLTMLLVFGAIFTGVGISTYAGVMQRRRDRRRILSEGTSSDALITKVTPDRRAGACRVLFSFQPTPGVQREARQTSTLEALKLAGLSEGSQVRVHYLAKWPQYAFSDALTVAERLAALKSVDTPAGTAPTTPPSFYFIAYIEASRPRQPPNAFRWTGDGDITITDRRVRFTALRTIPFWWPKRVERDFALDTLNNVEVFNNAVRCEITEPYEKARPLQFWTVNAAEATAIGGRLPDRKTASFAPQMAERAEFETRLKNVTPNAPVTPTLIAINAVMFVIAVALGGGVMVPHPEVMIRLGSNYTPLTAGGEWWRLLTATFLHFGLVHLAFNMWALWVNGLLVERLYGSARYLLIYLVAGLAGSVASFLWHPFVNGAGASGAIFGVLGALLAFFLSTHSGVPKSVLKTHRRTAALFIVVSMLNAARFPGIDNAAHLGGLTAGFIMGFLLARPLNATRTERDWAGQWVRAWLVVAGAALLLSHYLASGRLHPRLTYDPKGRPIPLATLAFAFGPQLHSFGGVTVGMTSAQLLKAKGRPIMRENPQDWVYNSIDAAHDGLLDVFLTDHSSKQPDAVSAVLYTGKPAAEPPGLPDLLGLNREELTSRLGAPFSEEDAGSGTRYLYFRNGVFVWFSEGKSIGYGLYGQRSDH